MKSSDKALFEALLQKDGFVSFIFAAKIFRLLLLKFIKQGQAYLRQL